MSTPEEELAKAQAKFDEAVEFVRRASREGRPIAEVEAYLMKQAVAMHIDCFRKRLKKILRLFG